MKKRLLLAIILLGLNCKLFAENNSFHSFSGASNHRVFLLVGGGVQTFIGNEEETSARFNTINPTFMVEGGLRLTPEVSVSFNLNLFSATSQSRYGCNPYIDFTDVTPIEGYYPYQSFTMYGGSLNCLLTLDLTNIFSGYSYLQKPFHILFPVGMGFSCLSGPKVNPKRETTPRNFEFSLQSGFIFDYQFSQRVAFFASPRITIQRGSIDYSPYSDNASSILDLIPSFSIGLRFNLVTTTKWISNYSGGNL